MTQLIERLIEDNFSQIVFVRDYHGQAPGAREHALQQRYTELGQRGLLHLLASTHPFKR